MVYDGSVGKMSDDDKLNAMNNLWRNFCVSDAFEPGSTAKPFTLATGLETGTLTGQEPMYARVVHGKVTGIFNVTIRQGMGQRM